MISGVSFDAPLQRGQIAELDKQAAAPDFWNDPQTSQKILQARKRLEEVLQTDEGLARGESDLEVLFELANEGEQVEQDIVNQYDLLKERVERIETQTL